MNLPLIRKLATGFLLLDVVVIGAAAVQVENVVAQTTSDQTGDQGLDAAGVPVPGGAGDLPVNVIPDAGGAPLAVPAGGVPLADAPSLPTLPTDGGDGEPAAPTSPGTTPGGKPGGKPTTERPDEGGVELGRSIPPCPIKLSDTPQTGGLQSLVPFAKAFGPFSAEAFALASAYQPELQLLGPILAQYPGIEPAVGPALSPLVASLGTLLSSGLDAIAPLYGPYRKQFIASETKLAAALAPYSQALAYNPLGGCLVELQSALLAASRSGLPGVPSPTGLDLSDLGLGGLL